ncbi:MAG: hypothetical protein GY743_23140 [Planctomycetaceae bacterium]|nr:hypothetical protein [Planctomycetaceae bacterium]
MPSERQSIVPFDQLFVFSTNLRPSELCDEAFLRRIPYKVHIPDPTARQIRELWQRQTQTHHVTCDAQWLDYLIEHHYLAQNRPMRFCHVDDLLSQIKEYLEFHEQDAVVREASLDAAVMNYFSAC